MSIILKLLCKIMKDRVLSNSAYKVSILLIPRADKDMTANKGVDQWQQEDADFVSSFIIPRSTQM